MSTLDRDVILTDSMPNTFFKEKHLKYIYGYGADHSKFDVTMTEYLRMSGMYWSLTALDLMNGGSKEENTKKYDKLVVEMIMACYDPSGGFKPAVGHDPHMLYTLSAVQTLSLYEALDEADAEKIAEYISKLQLPDGSFSGDIWGEVDVRFSFCAVMALSLLKRLDAINVDKAVEYVLSCKNFDGGFGSQPGSESHAGLIYCCVGVLSITGRLDAIDADELGWWLSERQLPSGGLNGRPEKMPDVCYSWWVLSSLTMLGRLHLINKTKIEKFILACQDAETGGFSDRPGDVVDPFHTLFGVAALSLLGGYPLQPINATYCLPQHVIDRMGLSPQQL